MNKQLPPNSDKAEDELVAYLDGELDAAARQQVEEKLGTDAAFRARLQSLQRAWDMLDVLPRTAASDSFTRSTIEMVAVSAFHDVEGLKQTSKKRFRWAWVFGSGGALVAAVIGYFIVSMILVAPERELLRHLPVLANLDFYRQADSVEFLRQLDREGLFSGAERGHSAMIEFAPNQSMNDRRKQLLATPATQLGELQSSQERFQRLSRDEQKHMLRVHNELSADPQAARLRQVLEQYIDWLKSLPSGQPAELRSLPADKRVAEIKRLAKEQEDQQFRRFAQNRPLPPEDTKVIFTWLDGWIERNAKQIEEQVPLAMERLRDVPDPQRRRIMMYAIYLRQRQEKAGERPGSEVLAPGAADVRELEKKLSPESQKILSKAQASHEELRLVQEWIRAAAFSRIRPSVSEEDLARFYREELTAADRARLDALPREEFQRELQKTFFEYRWKKNNGGRPFPKGVGPGGGPFGDGQRPIKAGGTGDRPERRDAPERREPEKGEAGTR